MPQFIDDARDAGVTQLQVVVVVEEGNIEIKATASGGWNCANQLQVVEQVQIGGIDARCSDQDWRAAVIAQVVDIHVDSELLTLWYRRNRVAIQVGGHQSNQHVIVGLIAR